MIGSLSPLPTQTAIASILAGSGQAPTDGGGDTGFGQLLASLPATPGAAPAAAAPTALQAAIDVATGLAADLPGANVQGTAEDAPAQQPILVPSASAQPVPTGSLPVRLGPIGAAPAPDADAAPTVPNASAADKAAEAATRLIAAATPRGRTAPANDPAASAPANDAAENAAGNEDAETPAATEASPVTPPPADPVAPDTTGLPTAIAVAAAPAQPALARALARTGEARPQAGKAVEDAAALRGESNGRSSVVQTAQKAPEAPQQLAEAAAATTTKSAKPANDTGAAVTVLFNQQIAAATTQIGEAAKAAPIAERVLDTTSDDQWIAQLAADIAATKSADGDISFRLVPRHLGRLDVAIRSEGDGVSLTLETQHEATATIVQAAQPRLVEDLRQQGVRVADAQVTHSAGETGRQTEQQGNQGRGQSPGTNHLIETAAERHETETDERTAHRRGRFA